MVSLTRNPWFSIWTQPRATIREILDTDPRRHVLWLAMLGGFLSALGQASIKNWGDRLPLATILLLCAVGGGIIGGPLGLYLGGFLSRWTGRWIGGQATSEQLRAAIAWSYVPVIWVGILWIPELALFGQEMFTSVTPRMEANPSLAFVMIGFGVLEIVVGIWTVMVALKCLGEAQRFSAWKALGNVLLALTVIVILALTLGVLLPVLVSGLG